MNISRLDPGFARLTSAERLALIAEAPDHRSVYRVGRLARMLGEECGCEQEIAPRIEDAARLHDIGKVFLAHERFNERGQLSEFERSYLMDHCYLGAELLASFDESNRLAIDVAMSHHEWWDGTGKPFNLVGTNIPFVARIVALADVYDSLTHRKPYRSADAPQAALEQILDLRGRQFDPDLTDLFVDLMKRNAK